MAFAHEREAENRAAWAVDNSKKKGSKELQSLACSINYDNSKDSRAKRSKSKAGQSRIKGHVNSCK